MTHALQNMAMLVELSISQPGFAHKNQRATRELAERDGTDARSAAVIDTLFKGKSLDKVASHAKWVRQHVVYKYTLPWSDSGARLLPTELYPDFMREYMAGQGKFDSLADAAASEYDDLLADAAERLGARIKDHRLPTKAEMRAAFSMRAHLSPVPDTSDFRVDLSDAVVDVLKQDLETRLTSTAVKSQEILFDKIEDLVGHIAESCRKWGSSTGKGGKHKMHSSTLEKLAEFVEVLPGLNVTGNEHISELCEMMRSRLTRYDVDDLKAHEMRRIEVAAEAEAILGRAAEARGKTTDSVLFGVAAE